MATRATCGSILAAAALAACTPTKVVPTGEDGAAYFGLTDGEETVYLRGDDSVEVHTVTRASEFPIERFVWDIDARQQGFSVDDRTMRVETTDTGLLLMRERDCVTQCDELAAPVLLLEWPLVESTAQEAEVDVVVTKNGVVSEADARSERHRTQVGTLVVGKELAGGTFDVYDVAWTRTVTPAGGIESVQAGKLTISPDVGVVAWDGFDGQHLERDVQ